MHDEATSKYELSGGTSRVTHVAHEFFSSSQSVNDIKGTLGIGIAFSGGGFRATLFHLGVIRALRDRGELENLRVVTSVSGGSIIAAHLVLNWEKYLGNDQEFLEAENELLNFIKSNPRAEIIAYLPLAVFSGIFCGLLRMLHLEKFAFQLESTFFPNCTGKLSALYGKHLFSRTTGKNTEYFKLGDFSAPVKDGLPSRPVYNALACNLTRLGDNSFFSAQGFHEDGVSDVIPCSSLHVSNVVAASSAFPFLFEPWLVSPYSIKVKNRRLNPTRQALTDGGGFDNLGVHRLLQIAKAFECKDQPLRALIVSDAGGAMDWDIRSRFSWIVPRLKRVSEILYRQSIELQKQRFEAKDNGVLVGLNRVIQQKQHLGDHAQSRLEQIRTDFDKFTDFEINALVNHGYVATQETIEKKWTLFANAWKQENRKNELPCAVVELDPAKQRTNLEKAAVKRLHLIDTLKHKVCLGYFFLFAGLLGFLCYRNQIAQYRVQSSTIREFLIRTDQRQKTPFASELSSSSSNMYFVGCWVGQPVYVRQL